MSLFQLLPASIFPTWKPKIGFREECIEDKEDVPIYPGWIRYLNVCIYLYTCTPGLMPEPTSICESTGRQESIKASRQDTWDRE